MKKRFPWACTIILEVVISPWMRPEHETSKILISSNPPWKDVNARFTMVPLRSLSDQVWIRYQSDNFHLRFYLRKWHAHFFLKRSKWENTRTKPFFESEKRRYIPHFFIRLRYRCKSGIAIFPWRVIWNYAQSPFNYNHHKFKFYIFYNKVNNMFYYLRRVV